MEQSDAVEPTELVTELDRRVDQAELNDSRVRQPPVVFFVKSEIERAGEFRGDAQTESFDLDEALDMVQDDA